MFGYLRVQFSDYLGPGHGLYSLRRHASDDIQQVIILACTAPIRAANRGWRRFRGVAPGSRPFKRQKTTSEVVDVTTITTVFATELQTTAQAKQWLDNVLSDGGVQLLERCEQVVNQLLHAYRIAARDPYCSDRSFRTALKVTAGYGTGDQLSKGESSHERSMNLADLRKPNDPVSAQTQIAALLGARRTTLMADDLLMRAQLDISAGRTGQAALQLQTAFRAAEFELAAWVDDPRLMERVSALQSANQRVDQLANAALTASLPHDAKSELHAAASKLKNALYARLQLQH